VSGKNSEGAPRFEMNGTLRNDLLWSRIAISAGRRADRTVAFAEDPFDAKKRVVVQTITPTTRPAAKLTVVVDGSAAMAPHWEPICTTFSQPRPEITQGVIAADQVIEIAAGSLGAAVLAATLRGYNPVRGQDAVPALGHALDLAGPDGVILWIHAAQPLLLQSPASLQARLSARRHMRIIEVNVGTGGNRVADALAEENLLESAPWAGTLSQTLINTIASETSQKTELRLQRELQEAAPTDPNAVRGNINLARLWAAGEVDRLVRGGATSDRDAATKLAIGHQLVTPVSGAVVLETKRQYEQNDLKPVTAVPIPPAIWAMLAMLPLVYLAMRRMMRSRERMA
jgi:hypothetical protein